MKKKTVKGFTLVELIVVMAIFGIIMFGAMSLMNPVSKVMIQSETYENGNAVVSNITNYLEGELTAAEFMDVYNGTRSEDAIAKDFAQYYYEGVLKKNSTEAHPIYAKGKVHVMMIDNTPDASTGVVNTQIHNYVYNADFTNGAVSVSIDPALTVANAINKAYYDNYRFEIKLGTFDDTTWLNPTDYVTFAGNVSAKNTTFTIKSETNRKLNNNIYTFFTTAAMSLSNINGRSLSDLNYYVIDEKENASDPTQPHTRSIVQIATPLMTARKSDSTCTFARYDGSLTSNSRVFYDNTGASLDNYYMVYSYGSEIEIQ